MQMKILIPSALLCMLVVSEVNAQSVGGANSYQTGAPIPIAPGNPNSSTVVTPEVPSSPMVSDDSSSKYVDSIMPSAGGWNPDRSSIYAMAPSNMDYDQFRSYLDKQWGVNGNAQVTAAQWNAIDPSYFGGRKPTFDSLPPSFGSPVDSRDLQSVYSSLYQRYQQYNNAQNNSRLPW